MVHFVHDQSDDSYVNTGPSFTLRTGESVIVVLCMGSPVNHNVSPTNCLLPKKISNSEVLYRGHLVTVNKPAITVTVLHRARLPDFFNMPFYSELCFIRESDFYSYVLTKEKEEEEEEGYFEEEEEDTLDSSFLGLHI